MHKISILLLTHLLQIIMPAGRSHMHAHSAGVSEILVATFELSDVIAVVFDVCNEALFEFAGIGRRFCTGTGF